MIRQNINILKQVNKGRDLLKSAENNREIKVNLYYNTSGEALQQIIERNIRSLVVKTTK